MGQRRAIVDGRDFGPITGKTAERDGRLHALPRFRLLPDTRIWPETRSRTPRRGSPGASAGTCRPFKRSTKPVGNERALSTPLLRVPCVGARRDPAGDRQAAQAQRHRDDGPLCPSGARLGTRGGGENCRQHCGPDSVGDRIPANRAPDWRCPPQRPQHPHPKMPTCSYIQSNPFFPL